MPLEAAFVWHAIELLKRGGRLLAVLPCSIVMGETTQWLRDYMLSIGAVRAVHELPPRCFPGVESRMYLMVFDKGISSQRIELLNHDLREPERIVLDVQEPPGTTRLDFGYVSAALRLQRLLRRKRLDWRKLGTVATFWRGDIESPLGPRVAVHSTDYSSGFWTASERHRRSVAKESSRVIRRGDLLITRVGRNAHDTIGSAIGLQGMPCSDCVVAIRPNNSRESLRLLFALRALLHQGWAKPLLERGTGASYISQRSLADLQIPMAASTLYSRQFHEFRSAERTRDRNRSLAAVSTASKYLGTTVAK